jgi:hypothetical protein
MVDAALVGIDQAEVITIAGLQDGKEWTRFEGEPSSRVCGLTNIGLPSGPEPRCQKLRLSAFP